ncbi:hypothetical protein Bca4012_044100 [Brassica carinata]|uniref:Uncharacterized protein n=2 Tax=Brassica TaxID=3705 RepID=A0ABQ7XFQ6_BRANA|nr:hypothetical protein Bca52824_058341 [Brassica carinata]KAH0854219.1 hypothetical protein HID58_090107 [Brassica napus]
MKCMSSGSPLMMVKNGNGNMMMWWHHLFSRSTPLVSITYRRQITTMTSKGMTAPPVMVSMIFCGLVQLGRWRRGSPVTHRSWPCNMWLVTMERDSSGYTFSSRLSHVPNNMNHNNDGFSGDERRFDLMSRGGW